MGRFDGAETLVVERFGQRVDFGEGRAERIVGIHGPAADAEVVLAQRREQVRERLQGHDHPLLMRRSLEGLDASWVLGKPAAGTAHAAKTRYRQADTACTLARVDDGQIRVDFREPQRAVTPGQSVVLYDDEVCLGGAVIAS